GFGQEPTVSISRVSDGDENGPQPGQFRVSVVAGDIFIGERSVEVFYSIVGASTAEAGSDFEPLSGQVTVDYNLITGGFANINVAVTDDDLIEENEFLTIELVPNENYNIGSPR